MSAVTNGSIALEDQIQSLAQEPVVRLCQDYHVDREAKNAQLRLSGERQMNEKILTWCRSYCESAKPLKEFKFRKVLYGWDYAKVERGESCPGAAVSKAQHVIPRTPARDSCNRL